MSNVKFSYLYRDGSNFKRWAAVVFSNPDRLPRPTIADVISGSLDQEGMFMAHQVRIPEVFLYDGPNANADDHCYHEFFEVDLTSEAPTDRFKRSIGEFIAEFRAQAHRGWLPFDPFDRRLRE